MMKGWMRLTIWLLPTLLLLLAVVWAAAAIWFDGPANRWAAGALAAAFALICLALLLGLRPYWLALVAVLVAFGAVLGWWLTIPPRSDRDWLPDVARTATAVVEGNQVTVGNLRNFDYRSETDFTARGAGRRRADHRAGAGCGAAQAHAATRHHLKRRCRPGRQHTGVSGAGQVVHIDRCGRPVADRQARHLTAGRSEEFRPAKVGGQIVKAVGRRMAQIIRGTVGVVAPVGADGDRIEHVAA